MPVILKAPVNLFREHVEASHLYVQRAAIKVS